MASKAEAASSAPQADMSWGRRPITVLVAADVATCEDKDDAVRVSRMMIGQDLPQSPPRRPRGRRRGPALEASRADDRGSPRSRRRARGPRARPRLSESPAMGSRARQVVVGSVRSPAAGALRGPVRSVVVPRLIAAGRLLPENRLRQGVAPGALDRENLIARAIARPRRRPLLPPPPGRHSRGRGLRSVDIRGAPPSTRGASLSVATCRRCPRARYLRAPASYRARHPWPRRGRAKRSAPLIERAERGRACS